MTTRVQFSLSSASDTCFWVLLSRAEVASSKIRIRGLGAMALAIIIRCFCPPEMPPWPSEISVFMPMGISRISCARPAVSAASQASSSVSCGAEMVMLEKMSPWNSCPFWITTPICLRRDRGSMLFRSCRS